MTLDEFTVSQKRAVEKFRAQHIKGVKRFNWATDMSPSQWQEHFEKWQSIYNEWIKECEAEE